MVGKTADSRQRRRKKEQRKVRDYQKLREDLQLSGRVPTTPEGAVKSERVDPATQGNQALPQLVREGLKSGWATPDAAKPDIVGALLEPFYLVDEVLDKDGNRVKVPPNRGMQIACAKVLKDLDVIQHERDNPEAAGKAKGGTNVIQVGAPTLLEAMRAANEKRLANVIEARIQAAKSQEQVP